MGSKSLRKICSSCEVLPTLRVQLCSFLIFFLSGLVIRKRMVMNLRGAGVVASEESRLMVQIFLEEPSRRKGNVPRQEVLAWRELSSQANLSVKAEGWPL